MPIGGYHLNCLRNPGPPSPRSCEVNVGNLINKNPAPRTPPLRKNRVSEHVLVISKTNFVWSFLPKMSHIMCTVARYQAYARKGTKLAVEEVTRTSYHILYSIVWRLGWGLSIMPLILHSSAVVDDSLILRDSICNCLRSSNWSYSKQSHHPI